MATKKNKKKLQESLIHTAAILSDLHSVWQPHEGQVAIGKAIFYDGKQFIFCECGRKFGKMLDLNEWVITPSGKKRLLDLSEGETVYDEMGCEQKIIKLHPIDLNPDSYRITFKNGQTIDACADHLWLTWTKKDRKNERRGLKFTPSIKTTLDMFETQMDGSEYNHSIPATQPIEYSEKDLLIEPYLLGLWLGDGGKNSARITTVDHEILDTIRGYGYEVSSYDYKEHGVKKLLVKLREINVLKNKHIPSEYLIGSINQRLELLQGLMDSDGTINKKGNYATFYNTDERIADGVFELVASLGMIPSKRVKKTTHKNCYSIGFRPLHQVFKLKRKLDRINPDQPKRNHHTIVSIDKIEPKPMRCVTVSGGSQLFLCSNSFIPTHNTDIVIYCLYRKAMTSPNSACYFIAPFQKQAKELIWANNRLQNFLPEGLKEKYVASVNNTEMRITFKNGSFIKLDGADNYEAYRGVNPHMVAYDEFKDHHPKFHEGMEPNLSTYKAPIIIIGTPPETDDNHYVKNADSIKQDTEAGAYFNMPSHTNPHIDPAWLEKQKERLVARGELDVWQREYMAMRVKGGKNSIFPMFDDETHVMSYDPMYEQIKKNRKHWDFYVTADPASSSTFGVLFSAIHRFTRVVYHLDELYVQDTRSTTARKLWERIEPICNGLNPVADDWTRTYDEAGIWFSNEVMDITEGEIYFMPTAKHLNKKEQGLSLIKDQMLYGFFYISDRCTKLRFEIINYIKDDKGKIPKENDHLIDCMRYTNAAANYTQITGKEPKPQPDYVKDKRRRFFTIGDDLREYESENDWTIGLLGESYYDRN